MKRDTLIKPYTTDASPSWNGYNHQGKVGIYVALKMMKDIRNEDMDKYELELEWFEDFSIKKEGEYKFIHQVKTYADTATSKYKDAIWLLLAKLLDIDGLEGAFLHVTQKLTNIDKLEEKLLTYVMSEDDKKKEETTSKILKNEKYATPKECHDKVIESGKYNEVFKKFALYDYDDGKRYCSLEDIEEVTKEKLHQLIGDLATETRVERAYYYLLGLVDRNIRERHIDIQTGCKKEKVSINFLDIQNIVYKDFEIISKEYASYYLKNEFYDISQSYLEDLKEEYEAKIISEEEHLILCKILKEINELDDEQFLDFCLTITPNNEVNKELPEHIIKMINQCLNKTALNDGFFEILKQIKREFKDKKWTYNKKNLDGLNITYLPSTIIDDDHPIRNRKLARGIINNANPELFNEVDKIITKSINLPSLEDSKVYVNVPDPEGEELDKLSEYHDRIIKIKKISLVDINNAKGELLS
ncbi:ABC-three component system protein [Mammaliicoccus sciuri]|uniref:ABC-three component system protein n=1 Tax=Mammaliicoccus sciuri TaxID=1296 RepID=UPI0018B0373B|nr:ABC-three component system protein [Mammaliicoccus sciuri]MBF9297711.1 hypothetical protein [Staphylococcus schleiferi]MDO0950114.1 hypothetical protein [Mammaliicoccus sciuri]MDO0954659.1 hypothetical protein [Mammaliicoccus sciuri]